MRRVAIGEAAVLTLKVYNDDGVAVEADGPVSVSVSDGDGVEIATGTATNDPAVGVYTYTLPETAVDTVDLYEVVWEADVATRGRTWTTRYEVVGGHYFELADLRTFNAAIEENPSRYTAAKLRDARDTASERLDTECALAFTPRRARQVLRGSGRRVLVLQHNAIRALYGVAVDGVEFTEDELDLVKLLDFGLELPAGNAWDPDTEITVDYEHGLDEPDPSVVRAAKLLAVDYLIPSAIPARAKSETTDLGTVSYSLAGRDGATGIPEVDAVIVRYGRNTPTVI